MADRRVLLAVLLALALGTVAFPSSASVETDSAYTKAQTYHAALRYLRVDLSYEVVERDPDAAYLLFRFVPTGRKAPSSGSIEIVERSGGVRLLVRLPELPRYQAQVLSEGLMRKLRGEYGEPPRPEEPPPRKKEGSKGGQPAEGDAETKNSD